MKVVKTTFRDLLRTCYIDISLPFHTVLYTCIYMSETAGLLSLFIVNRKINTKKKKKNSLIKRCCQFFRSFLITSRTKNIQQKPTLPSQMEQICVQLIYFCVSKVFESRGKTNFCLVYQQMQIQSTIH